MPPTPAKTKISGKPINTIVAMFDFSIFFSNLCFLEEY